MPQIDGNLPIKRSPNSKSQTPGGGTGNVLCTSLGLSDHTSTTRQFSSEILMCENLGIQLALGLQSMGLGEAVHRKDAVIIVRLMHVGLNDTKYFSVLNCTRSANYAHTFTDSATFILRLLPKFREVRISCHQHTLSGLLIKDLTSVSGRVRRGI